METQQKVHFSGDYEIPETLTTECAAKWVKEDVVQIAAQHEVPHNFRMTSSSSTLSAEDQPINIVDFNLTQSSITRQMQHLCYVLHHGLFVTDVKLLMFVAAANCDDYRSTLVPIPPIFMTDTFYDIEKLRLTVATWPSCCQMLRALRMFDDHGHRLFTALGAENVNLLHWLLVSQSGPKIRSFGVRYLSKICKNLKVELPTVKPNQILRVRYRMESGTVKSQRRHVYFGCPLNMLYRLLIRGDMDIDWAKSLRCYHKLEPALAQCDEMSFPLPTKCWPHSRFGRSPRCMTICELLDSSQPITEEFVIKSADCLRVRYLLFFDGKPEFNLPITSAEDDSYNNIFYDETPIFISCGLLRLGHKILCQAKKLISS